VVWWHLPHASRNGTLGFTEQEFDAWQQKKVKTRLTQNLFNCIEIIE